MYYLQVVHPWKNFPVRITEACLLCHISCKRTNFYGSGNCGSSGALCKHELLFRPLCRLNKSFSSQYGFFVISHGRPHRSRRHTSSLREVMSHSGTIRQHVSVVLVRLLATMFLVTSLSVAVSSATSCNFYFV